MAVVSIASVAGRTEAAGDLQYSQGVDPVTAADRSRSYTLEAGWDFSNGRLRLFSDRLGMIPIFVHQTPNRMVISSSLAELTRHLNLTRLDAEALSVFFRLGFFIGNNTAIEGIKVLPPGVELIASEGLPEIGAHSVPIVPWQPSLDCERALSEYEMLFRESIGSRFTDEALGLPLSGGRDSRHILLEMQHQNRQPDFALTVCGGAQSKSERDIAAQLCQRLGLRHVVFYADDQFDVERELKKNIVTHFLSDEHTVYTDIVRALQSHGARAAFDGLGGDVLSNGLFFDPLLLGALREGKCVRAAEILLGPAKPFGFFSREWEERLSWESARDLLSHELEKHVAAANPIASFFFWNRTRREIALAPVCLMSTLNVALPYIDRDLLSFFLRLPAEQFGKRGFHDDLIRTRYPEAADVPYSGKETEPRWRKGAQLQQRVGYAEVCLRASRRAHAAPSFILARMARGVALGSMESDLWWFRPIVHLDGLEKEVTHHPPLL